MQGDVQAQQQQGQVGSLFVQPAPEEALTALQPDGWQHTLRYHHPTEDDRSEGDKQQAVEHVIEARSVAGFLEEAPRHGDDPFPVQQQVDDQRGAQCQTEPFVDRLSGQIWRSRD